MRHHHKVGWRHYGTYALELISRDYRTVLAKQRFSTVDVNDTIQV